MRLACTGGQAPGSAKKHKVKGKRAWRAPLRVHPTRRSLRRVTALLACPSARSGLLTIGPRFGGAIDDAARYFKQACDAVRDWLVSLAVDRLSVCVPWSAVQAIARQPARRLFLSPPPRVISRLPDSPQGQDPEDFVEAMKRRGIR